jgi:hypothetical protein
MRKPGSRCCRVDRRIERDADWSRDAMYALDWDFDGSKVADVELHEATAKACAGDVATGRAN